MTKIEFNTCEYYSETGRKKIYTKLQEIKKYSPFPDDFKINIHHYSDLYGTSDSKHGEILYFLLVTLSDIDIPNFFVEIFSSNKCIQVEIDNLVKQGIISNSDLPKITLVDCDFSKKVKKRESFCVLPWIHYYISPQGDFAPCCVADLNHSLGSIRKNKINNLIFKNQKLNNLRKSMLNNEEPEACSYCWEKENQNLNSMREQHNKTYKEIIPSLISNTRSNGEFNSFKLKKVDSRFNNTCNLKCRMCSGVFSSKIAAEEAKFFNKDYYLKNSISNNEQKQIVDNIKENIDNIDSVYFAGGEPLILDSHYEILDLLHKHNKTDIEISYNTNFTTLNFKNYNILEYWKKFNNVTVGASIDLIGDQGSYIRDGTNYNDIENNFLKLKSECPHVKFTITSILHVFNIENLMYLQKHWISNNKLDSANLSFNLLINPEYMSITVLPKHVKKYYSKLIKQHIQDLLNLENSQNLQAIWESAYETMNKFDNSHLIPKLLEDFKLKDKIREKNIEDYFPVLYNELLKEL